MRAVSTDEFPQACVQPDKIFVRDGRLFTSAGVTAGIDLCLSLVAEDWGHELGGAGCEASWLSISSEKAASLSTALTLANGEEDPIIGKVLGYVTEHITDTLSIEQLASAVSVSRRTFSRLFAKYAKVTPSAFVEQVRVDTARKLLEETDAPLKTVAFKCGFRSATHMRRLSPTARMSRRNNIGNDSVVRQAQQLTSSDVNEELEIAEMEA